MPFSFKIIQQAVFLDFQSQLGTYFSHNWTKSGILLSRDLLGHSQVLKINYLLSVILVLYLLLYVTCTQRSWKNHEIYDKNDKNWIHLYFETSIFKQLSKSSPKFNKLYVWLIHTEVLWPFLNPCNHLFSTISVVLIIASLFFILKFW